MTTTGEGELGYMGKYVRDYRPGIANSHRIVNEVFGKASIQAFPHGAVVVQQKKIPDVSFWQEIIRFELMRQMTDAIIIRAGQNTWEDTQFRRNWSEARRLGMLRGAYWFYDDRESPGEQAELFVELLKDDPPELEIYADWENTYGGAFGGLRNVVAFMEAVERGLPGVEIGMYTGYWWFREHSNAVTNAGQYAYLTKRKLFEAWYTSIASQVLIPNPWTSIHLWQFGTPAVGAQYGVATKEIDMSYINMTEEEFQQRYRGGVEIPTPPLPPPPTGEPMQKQGTVTSTVTRGLNVRDPQGTVIAALWFDRGSNKGDVVYGEVNGNRIYFNKIYRVNGSVANLGTLASAVISEGSLTYLSLADVPEPGTDPDPDPQPGTLPSPLYIGTLPDGSDAEKYEKA